jgi:hypothetical protein
MLKNFLIPLKSVALKSLDISFSLFIITPILVTNWYSLWSILDFLLTSNIGRVISFVVGVCGQFVILFYQDLLLAKTSKSNEIILVFMSRVFLLISSIVSIFFWRAIWNEYDSILLPDDDNSIVMNIVQNSVILMLCGVYRNCMASPFVLLDDFESISFDNRTILRKCVSFGKIVCNQAINLV